MILFALLFACVNAFATDTACQQTADRALSDLRHAAVAKNPRSALEGAKRTLEQGPATCHEPAWYLAAMRLLRDPMNGGRPLVIGERLLQDPVELMGEGLPHAVEGGQLLAYVAYLAAMEPAYQGLAISADCAKPEQAPSTRYVCAHLAAGQGQYAGATALLEELSAAELPPDVGLRQAFALAGAGKRCQAKRAAKSAQRALTRSVALRAGATLADLRLMQEQLKALAQTGRVP